MDSLAIGAFNTFVNMGSLRTEAVRLTMFFDMPPSTVWISLHPRSWRSALRLEVPIFWRDTLSVYAKDALTVLESL